MCHQHTFDSCPSLSDSEDEDIGKKEKKKKLKKKKKKKVFVSKTMSLTLNTQYSLLNVFIISVYFLVDSNMSKEMESCYQIPVSQSVSSLRVFPIYTYEATNHEFVQSCCLCSFLCVLPKALGVLPCTSSYTAFSKPLWPSLTPVCL